MASKSIFHSSMDPFATSQGTCENWEKKIFGTKVRQRFQGLKHRSKF
jgi:hypothetical protein